MHRRAGTGIRQKARGPRRDGVQDDKGGFAG